jgi:hypothetical protein
MTRKQSGQAVGFKSRAPPIDVTVTAVEFATNLRPRMAVGQEQDQPSATPNLLARSSSLFADEVPSVRSCLNP